MPHFDLKAHEERMKAKIRQRVMLNYTNKLQTYEEWLLDSKETSELGVKLLVTSALLKETSGKLVETLFDAVRDAYKAVVFREGIEPLSIEFIGENDATMRGREISSLIKAQHGSSLQEYGGVIYTHASKFYNEVKVWENKSLWGYVKWWIQMKFKGKFLS